MGKKRKSFEGRFDVEGCIVVKIVSKIKGALTAMVLE